VGRGRTRGVFAGVALLAAVAAVAGCGGEAGKPDPQTIVQAARTTDGKGGVHVVFEATLDIEDAPRSIEFRGEGDEDRRARSSEYDVDFSSLAALDPSAGSPDDWRGAVVKRGPVAWAKLGVIDELLTQLGFRAGSWIEMDLRRRPDSRTELGRSLAQLNEQDPGQLLDYVHAAEATERVGEETVAGVRTVHYRGRVVLDDVVAALPSEERAAVQENVERVMEGIGGDELPIDVWIGRDALIRRIRLHYDFERNPQTGQRLDAELEATADLSGFGRRVVPRVPPDEEVVDVAELIEAAE
jgi:hypothetical protein